MSKKTSKEIFIEAIYDLARDYEGDPMKVPLAGARRWVGLKYPATKASKTGFYSARTAIEAGRRKTATVAAAGGLAVPPLQLIRTIKGWAEMYGKNELIAMIDEICP